MLPIQRLHIRFNQLHNKQSIESLKRDRPLWDIGISFTIGVSLLFGGIGGVGCNGSPQVEQKDTPSAQSPPAISASPIPSPTENPGKDGVQLPVTASPIYSSTVSPTIPPRSLVTVTIYKADRDCIRFIPQPVQVERDRPIEAAVAQVLQEFSFPNFQLSDYQVQLDQSGAATIDLQPTATSRPLTALSACEQLALFGSLRETLTQNTDWQIKTLRFTQDGQELSL